MIVRKLLEMLKSFLIIDRDGKILMEKPTEPMPNDYLKHFLQLFSSDEEIAPIFESKGFLFITNQVNDLYIVGISNSSESIHFISSFLSFIAMTIEQLFAPPLNKSKLFAEYSSIYQIIELSLDGGLPLIDEPNSLARISQLGTSFVPSVSRISWRNVFTSSNQLYFFLTVQETIYFSINRLGHLTFSQTRVRLHISSSLPSNSLCRLELELPPSLQDYSLHRCLDYIQFPSQILSFIPPYGTFELLSYTIKNNFIQDIPTPLFCTPCFNFIPGKGLSISLIGTYQLIPEAQFTQISLFFELPLGLKIPTLSVTEGNVLYKEDERIVTWQLPNQTHLKTVKLDGYAPVIDNSIKNIPIPYVNIHFESTGYILSQFSIKKVILPDQFDKINKIIKYYSKSGRCEFESIQK